MQSQWNVTLSMRGRRIDEVVTAHSQSEARRKAERMNPDYKAGAAKRI